MTPPPIHQGPLTRRQLFVGVAGTAGLVMGTGGVVLAQNRGTEAAIVPTAAPEHFGRAWMVLATEDDAAKARARAAGATHGHVRAFWDQLQPTAGATVDPAPVLREIEAVRSAGLQVCLEVCLQYPPAFVLTGVQKLRDQFGTEWAPAQHSGGNIRDWVWSDVGRGYVADFIDQLFGRLDWSRIERVKLGGMTKGELQYPSSEKRPQFWAYSAAAQAMCPVPGHVLTPADPATGAGRGWTKTDQTFATWYVQSLVEWMNWLIARFRRHFSGPVYVMHPGAGIRPVSQTPTSPRQAYNYQINLGSGLDWDASIAAYPDAQVRPYTTWIDADHFWGKGGFSLVEDGNGAPWWALMVIARKYGRAGRMWGENTGGQSAADLLQIVRQQAVAHGYEGLAWLDDASLRSGPGARYSDLAAAIASP